MIQNDEGGSERQRLIQTSSPLVLPVDNPVNKLVINRETQARISATVIGLTEIDKALTELLTVAARLTSHVSATKKIVDRIHRP